MHKCTHNTQQRGQNDISFYSKHAVFSIFAHTCMEAYARMHTRAHSNTHTHARARAHDHIHTQPYFMTTDALHITHTHTHTTYTHTHTHTHCCRVLQAVHQTVPVPCPRLLLTRCPPDHPTYHASTWPRGDLLTTVTPTHLYPASLLQQTGSLYLLQREDLMIIVRLSTGHCRLRHHMSTRLHTGHSAVCPWGTCPVTVERLLQNCPTHHNLPAET